MNRLMVFALALMIFASACFLDNNTASKEQKLTEENQSVLLANQPPVRLEWSLERDNINRRTNLWNDPAKIGHVYLLSDMGQIIAHYVIKGKISSVNSQITNPEQGHYYGSGGAVTLPSPAEDGSYGTNGDAVFFFTSTGAYVEWNGAYIWSDVPFTLSVEPLLVTNE